MFVLKYFNVATNIFFMPPTITKHNKKAFLRSVLAYL